ncbi:MAG: phosphatidylglycerophosphatase A family protein [Burkholderiales bacterium]|jgi:phosphatidylglycerophosphatase A
MPDTTSTDTQPNWRFMCRHPAHLIALGFGAGLAPKAPGTVGTLWAWAAYLVMDMWLSPTAWAGVIAVGFIVGCWACKVCAEHMQIMDSGHMVWDEVIAFWLVLYLVMPQGLIGQAIAFGLFRFFDAVKFGPTAWADQYFKGFGWRGGFGVMVDDIVAGALTLLVWSVGVRALAYF